MKQAYNEGPTLVLFSLREIVICFYDLNTSIPVDVDTIFGWVADNILVNNTMGELERYFTFFEWRL